MKKFLCIFCTITLFFSLFTIAGCSGSSSDGKQSSDKNSSAAVDVDLTSLSSTMVYSEVYNMLTKPDEYIGKTVKMHGQFSLFQATDASGQPIPEQIYFACVIADATACCQQGIEFVLSGEHTYPDDYPAISTEITVVGQFQTYLEGASLYCHLTNASMEIT